MACRGSGVRVSLAPFKKPVTPSGWTQKPWFTPRLFSRAVAVLRTCCAPPPALPMAGSKARWTAERPSQLRCEQGFGWSVREPNLRGYRRFRPRLHASMASTGAAGQTSTAPGRRADPAVRQEAGTRRRPHTCAIANRKNGSQNRCCGHLQRNNQKGRMLHRLDSFSSYPLKLRNINPPPAAIMPTSTPSAQSVVGMKVRRILFRTPTLIAARDPQTRRFAQRL
jgi:hypothetical protein